MLNHWWRQLVRRFGYRLNAPRGGKPQKRPRGYRPRLETLEDRTLMTAGILDSAFGNGGLVNTSIAGDDDFAGGVAVQANGKIVVVGQSVNTNGDNDFVVVRYNSNGTLDGTFGFGGRVTTGFGAGTEDVATAVVIQADGRIVVGGFTGSPGSRDFVVARYLASGSLDTTFGGGDGIEITDFGGDDALTALALRTNGTIVAAGNTTTGVGTSDFALAMYTTAGALDGSFDTDGRFTINFIPTNNDDAAFAVKIDSADRIVVAGFAFDGVDSDFAIARLSSTGLLDGTFGTGGLVTTDFSGTNVDDVANAIGFLSSGRIAVGGYAVVGGEQDFALAVYSSGGVLSAAFSGDGKVTTDIRGDDTVSALVVNTINGVEGVVVVGSAFLGTTFDDSQFALARYTVNGATAGALDLNFGANATGVVTTTFGLTSTVATAVAVDSLGRLVTAGYADLGATNYDFALARYLVDDPFSLTPIKEDPGTAPPSTLVSDIVRGQFAAVAVTGLNNTANGVWQFSTNGTTFVDFGPVSPSAARLLLANATTRIRFKPNANFNGDVSLTLVSWNPALGGTAGGVFDTTQTPAAFGGDAIAAILTIIPVNDAPVLNTATTVVLPGTAPGNATPDAPTLPVTVASFLGSLATDVDGNTAGIAITAVTGNNPATQGIWRFSTDGGATFKNFGTAVTTGSNTLPAPSTVGTVSATTALLLRATDLILYDPVATFSGTVTFTFRAWDGTTGSAGTRVNASAAGVATAFSTGLEVANVPININFAPVLAAGTPKLNPVDVNDINPAGNIVGPLLGTSVVDVPTALKGMAIVAVTVPAGSGVWQFALQETPTNWINFGTTSVAGSTGGNQTFGTVSATGALLLRENDLVRFLPNLNFTNTTAAAAAKPTFTFRAWDQTGTTLGKQGIQAPKQAIGTTGGSRPYSTTTQVASVLVNRKPTIAPTVAPQPTGTEDVVFTSASLTTFFTVGDVGTGTTAAIAKGLAIIGVTGNGTWSYSNAPTGTFAPIAISSSVSTSTAKLIAANARLRFTPAKNFNGTATITVVAWDRTVGALNGTINLNTLDASGKTAFSSDIAGVIANSARTLTLTITPVNDAPVLSGSKNLSKIATNITNLANIGDAVSTIASPFISDVDGNPRGIAIIGTNAALAQGHWEFSNDGGTNWFLFPALPLFATNAVLLAPSARVRFVPANGFTGTVSLTFRAWDGSQSTQSAGDFDSRNISGFSTGGISAFSALTQSVTLQVDP
jgi:uncharacterized delta-60 repeat protein